MIAGAIELLARSRGSHARAAAAWGAAGLIGLAVGPAAGGLLTELISWQAIFAVQVPVVVLVVAARPVRGTAERGRPGRSELAPELALGLVSAGLAGALFLLVVLPIMIGGGGAARERGGRGGLVAVAGGGGRRSLRRAAVYLALGGASFKPLEAADPRRPRPADRLRGRDQVLQRLALSALSPLVGRARHPHGGARHSPTRCGMLDASNIEVVLAARGGDCAAHRSQ